MFSILSCTCACVDFQAFGEVESIVHDDSEPSMVIDFRTRKDAEKVSVWCQYIITCVNSTCKFRLLLCKLQI